MPQSKHNHRYYAIKNSADRTAEVLIYGQIRQPSFWDEYFGLSDSVSAKSFRRELTAALKDADRVTVRINSYGGDVAEGNAIISALKNCGKPTTALVDGVAYSMAAVIALACNETYMPTNTLLMLHAPRGGEYGTSHDLRTTADVLDKYGATLAETIAARTGTTPEQAFAKYMDREDHFFTAREAKTAMLITDVKEYESAQLPTVENLRDGKQLTAWFNENPIVAEESNDFTQNWWKRAAALLTPKNSKTEAFTLKTLNAILAAHKAGEPLTLTAEQLTSITAEVNTATNGGKFVHTAEELSQVQAQLTNANGTVDSQKTEITNLKTQVTTLTAQLQSAPSENHTEPVSKGNDPVDNPQPNPMAEFETSWDRAKRAERAADKALIK